MTPPALVEHFFRHEYGRLVAMLARRLGMHQLEAIEDSVQAALLAGLESWGRHGIPDNPSAWLFRVATNEFLGDARKQNRRLRLDERVAALGEPQLAPPLHPSLRADVPDDLLRMLVYCCDEALPLQTQIVLALKTLCGFDVREIACRLFTSEANVYKRLARARAHLKQGPRPADNGEPHSLPERLNAVRKVLYVLFTEGYLSSHATTAIRRQLCDEAIRLATLVARHPLGQQPESFALLALMHLHAARITSRQDGLGGLLLLEEQHRALWDPGAIQRGLAWLARSAEGDAFSRYHAEAGVAAEHCLATSLDNTRWDRIVACYRLLEAGGPAPLHTLARAVAVAEWQGPQAGLASLAEFEPPRWLRESHLWHAVLADLNQRCGNREAAHRFTALALQAAPSEAIVQLLMRRLIKGEPPNGARESATAPRGAAENQRE